MLDLVVVDYTNHRGERSEFTIRPQSISYGSNEWHPELQWLLDCFVLDKKARRTLAMKDIHSWTPLENAS